MPTIAMIGKIKIMIYFDDHGRPHIHAVGPGCEAKIEIWSLAVIRNDGLTAKEIRLVVRFIEQNQQRLMEAWTDAQS